MSKTSDTDYDMQPEYALDYTKGVRGKYYEAAMRNKGFAKLDKEVLEAFPTNADLNEALHRLMEASRLVRQTPHTSNTN